MGHISNCARAANSLFWGHLLKTDSFVICELFLALAARKLLLDLGVLIKQLLIPDRHIRFDALFPSCPSVDDLDLHGLCVSHLPLSLTLLGAYHLLLDGHYGRPLLLCLDTPLLDLRLCLLLPLHGLIHSSEYHLHRLFGDLEQRLNILRPLLKICLVLELHLLWQAALHHGDDLLEFIECIMRHNFLVGAYVVR